MMSRQVVKKGNGVGKTNRRKLVDDEWMDRPTVVSRRYRVVKIKGKI